MGCVLSLSHKWSFLCSQPVRLRKRNEGCRIESEKSEKMVCLEKISSQCVEYLDEVKKGLFV